MAWARTVSADRAPSAAAQPVRCMNWRRVCIIRVAPAAGGRGGMVKEGGGGGGRGGRGERPNLRQARAGRYGGGAAGAFDGVAHIPAAVVHDPCNAGAPQGRLSLTGPLARP